MPVSDDGVAEIDLTSDTAAATVPSPEQLELMVSQLAWTLRQDPSVSRLPGHHRRPAGARCPAEPRLQRRRTATSTTPSTSGSSTLLFGLQDGLMVGGSPQNLAPVTGPFGAADYGLRTVAVRPPGRARSPASRPPATSLSAGAGQGHRRAIQGPDHDRATRPAAPGVGLRRPAVGGGPTADRRERLLPRQADGTTLPLDVPGISGKDVKDFLVSRDGSRLVAVVRENAEDDSIVVSRIRQHR